MVANSQIPAVLVGGLEGLEGLEGLKAGCRVTGYPPPGHAGYAGTICSHGPPVPGHLPRPLQDRSITWPGGAWRSQVGHLVAGTQHLVSGVSSYPGALQFTSCFLETLG